MSGKILYTEDMYVHNALGLLYTIHTLYTPVGTTGEDSFLSNPIK